MNILVVTSEAVPFAKTGGLADVCGTLPVELAKLGHETAVIMPCYASARQAGPPIELAGADLAIPIGSKTVRGRLLQSTLPGSLVPVYLVEQNQYFDRPDLYGSGGQDYVDNCERFVFFCRAVLEAVRLLELKPDILHCNDWQTGLVPAYLKAEQAGYGVVSFGTKDLEWVKAYVRNQRQHHSRRTAQDRLERTTSEEDGAPAPTGSSRSHEKPRERGSGRANGPQRTRREHRASSRSRGSARKRARGSAARTKTSRG